jgi:hypothetical protein
MVTAITRIQEEFVKQVKLPATPTKLIYGESDRTLVHFLFFNAFKNFLR